jgi:hypothetical protein
MEILKYFIGILFLIALNWKIVVLFSISSLENPSVKDDNLLKNLFDKAISYQVLKEQNYTPPFHWAEKLGIIHLIKEIL